MTLKTLLVAACALLLIGDGLLAGRWIVDAINSERNRRDQEKEAKSTAENYKRIQSKEAWKQALKLIDVRFEEWLKGHLKADKNHYIDIQWEYVKGFTLADIEWRNGTHVIVHGLLLPWSPKMQNATFSWTRRMELATDGVDSWWKPEEPAFQYHGDLTEDQQKQMRVELILEPGGMKGIGHIDDPPFALPVVR